MEICVCLNNKNWSPTICVCNVNHLHAAVIAVHRLFNKCETISTELWKRENKIEYFPNCYIHLNVFMLNSLRNWFSIEKKTR